MIPEFAQIKTFVDSCQKWGYDTKALADVEVLKMAVSRKYANRPGRELCAYLCEECYLWHVGNSMVRYPEANASEIT